MGQERSITLIKKKRARMKLQLFMPHKVEMFLYPLLFPNNKPSLPCSGQSLPLESHRHGGMERQMVVEEKEKEK